MNINQILSKFWVYQKCHTLIRSIIPILQMSKKLLNLPRTKSTGLFCENLRKSHSKFKQLPLLTSSWPQRTPKKTVICLSCHFVASIFQNITFKKTTTHNEFLQITARHGSALPDQTRLCCNNIKFYQCQNCFDEFEDMLELIDHQIENEHDLEPRILMKEEFLYLVDGARVMASVDEFCKKCHSARTCFFSALPRTHMKKHGFFWDLPSEHEIFSSPKSVKNGPNEHVRVP